MWLEDKPLLGRNYVDKSCCRSIGKKQTKFDISIESTELMCSVRIYCLQNSLSG